MHVTAIVLAAGLSTRMGSQNKLLLPIDGKPMLRQCIETLLASDVNEIIVVLGHEAGAVNETIEELPLRCIINANYQQGMASSIVAGIRALPANSDGALIALGDMPDIKPETIGSLIAAFEKSDGQRVCQPVFDQRPGNPVLWPSTSFAALSELSGDRGGKALLSTTDWEALAVPVDDPGIHFDIDQPDAEPDF